MAMLRWIFVFLLMSHGAWAQGVLGNWGGGPTQIIPPPLHGCAVVSLSAGTTTLNASTVTNFCYGTTALPTSTTQVTFYPQNGSANVLLCPLSSSGTCSVGQILSQQQSVTKGVNLTGANPPAVYTATATDFYMDW
jgi:hypothetical protein